MEKREAAAAVANAKQPPLAPAPAVMATQQPAAAAAAEASVLAQAAETLQKQQAAAAAAATQAQFQVEQKKEAPATGAVVPPQVEKSIEENGSAGAVEQPARKPMPGQVKPHQPLQKDNSGELGKLAVLFFPCNTYGISAPPALGPQQPAAAAAAPASAPQPPPSAPAEPMSYASLVKTGPSAAAASANPGDASGKADQRPRGGYGEPPKSDEAAGGVKTTQQQTGAASMRPGGAPGGSGGAPGGGPRSSGGGGGIGGERGVGGPVQYPDGQQLFVGNLPHNCTEDDLRELFGHYGKVADIRISNKGAAQSKQQPAGARVPNFGFVSFEEARAVQRVLSHLEKKPIFLYDNHRLNVEEKKTKVGGYNERIGPSLEQYLKS